MVNTRSDPTGNRSQQVVTSVDNEASVTKKRPVPVDVPHLVNPGCPRAAQAVDRFHPDDPNRTRVLADVPIKNKTIAQQHVDFWDRDEDGWIWPWDTYIGFRRCSFNPLYSFAAVFFIHGSFSYASLDSWLPHPFFPIHVKNMHACKHGSDTEVQDTEGRFVPQKFEELFTKYDEGNKGALSFRELWRMTEACRNIIDPTGWTAAKLEWVTLWLLAKDEKGLVSREKMLGQYDGSLFYQVAKEQDKKLNLRAMQATAPIFFSALIVGLWSAALFGAYRGIPIAWTVARAVWRGDLPDYSRGYPAHAGTHGQGVPFMNETTAHQAAKVAGATAGAAHGFANRLTSWLADAGRSLGARF